MALVIMIAMFLLGCDDQTKRYEISFHTNGGSEIQGLTVSRSTWDGSLPIPIREGYFFVGWYLEPELMTPATKETIDEQGRYAVHLYAKWEEADVEVVLEHWVADFDGTFILHSTTMIGGVIGQDVLAVPMIELGFTEIADHPDRVSSTPVLAEGTATLKLYYSRNTVTLTYYYHPGVDVVKVTGLAFSPLPLRTEGTEDERHDFEGWYYDYVMYSFPYTATVMPGMDTTVYAKWTYQPVTVTLMKEDGSGPNILQGIPFTSMDLFEPYRDGYVFYGWFYDSDYLIPYEGIDLLSGPDKTVFPWENMTLYAKWVGEDTIATTYHWYEDDKGEFKDLLITTEIVTIGELVTATPTLQYNRYHKFMDSHPDQVLSGVAAYGQPLVLHIYYERMTFNLTIDHGFDGTKTVIPVKYGFKMYPFVPQVIREGYAFSGLKYGETGDSWVTGDSRMPMYDQTIRMIWTERWYKTYLVTNSEMTIEPMTLKFGTEYVLPTPTRQGYVFLGWYADEELTILCPNAGIVPAQMQTFYAKWEHEPVTVTFVTNADFTIEPMLVAYGTSYALPAPEKEGYLFGGWYRDPELTERFIQTTSMTELDLTLYAKWLNMTYMIHFDTMGGQYVQDLVLAPGSPLVLPIPTRTGFDFVGWFNASLTVQFTGTVMPETNLVLYAKWQLKS